MDKNRESTDHVGIQQIKKASNPLKNILSDSNIDSMIKDFMVHRDEYIDIALKTMNDWDKYQTKFEKNIRWDGRLYFFGDTHKRDLSDPEFDRMIKFWKDFFEKNQWKKNIVLVEWGIRRKKIDIIKEKHRTTSQVLQYIANQNNCEVISPEPTMKDEVDYALWLWIDKDTLVYYYVWRVISQRHRWWSDMGIEQYLNHFFDDEHNQYYYIYKKPRDINFFEELHKKIFDTEIDFQNAEHRREISNPYKENPISKANYISWRYRDITVLRKVLDLLEQGYNVLMAYGRWHVIVQYKVYNHYFGERRWV